MPQARHGGHTPQAAAGGAACVSAPLHHTLTDPVETGPRIMGDVDTRFDIPADDDALLAQCEVQTFRGTGPGGQSVNTTDSAVRLQHLPSGITVVCRRERSQYLNKKTCLERLRRRLEEHNAALQAPERVPTTKPRAAKARQVEAKRRRARIKSRRARVEMDEE